MGATERTAMPYFIGDHLALDFLNSRVGPPHEPKDWLAAGSALIGWLLKAGAIDSAVARRFRTKGKEFGELDAVAEQARKLRDWLAEFVERHAGEEIGPEVEAELAPLNRLLARDEIYRVVARADPQAEEHGHLHAWQWREMRRWTAPEHLLMPIAQAIGDLVCTADFRLVRMCEGSGCILAFYDRTKAHRRRWCSMAICGNRAKVAAHRARSRSPKSRATPQGAGRP